MHNRSFQMLFAFSAAAIASAILATVCDAAVTTGSPQHVVADSATLTGDVAGAVAGSTFHFEFWWDEVPQHVIQTVAEAGPSGPEALVMQNVYALSSTPQEGLLYTYRIVVDELGQVVLGQPVSFRTTASPTKALPTPPQCQVTDVVGRSLKAALRLLRKPRNCATIRVVIRSHRVSTRQTRRVLAQSISPGRHIRWDGTVVLHVSP